MNPRLLSKDGKTIEVGLVGHDTRAGRDNGLTEVYSFNNATLTWGQKGNRILGFHYKSRCYDAQYGWSVAMSASGNRVRKSGIYDGDSKEYYWSGAVKVYD